jgi:hypothetical protein
VLLTARYHAALISRLRLVIVWSLPLRFGCAAHKVPAAAAAGCCLFPACAWMPAYSPLPPPNTHPRRPLPVLQVTEVCWCVEMWPVMLPFSPAACAAVVAHSIC